MGDLTDFHLPLRYLYRSALLEGQSILWTPKLFAGFYVLAEGQVGPLHPLHLILYRLLPLTIAFNLELAASYVFCFAGMCLLLRRLGSSVGGSLIGAIAFTFSGFNLLHLLHMNAVAVVSHVPWLLLALEGVFSGLARRQRSSLVGIALLTGSMLLLGYPQYVWMVALICIIYVAVNASTTSLRPLAIAAAGAVAGIMLGGLQLLPTIDLLSQSRRAAVAADFSLTYSLHPLNLAQFFSPYLLTNWVYAPPEELKVHEFGAYNGAYCTVAAVWVLLRWRHLPLRRLALFAGTLVVAGLVLALGRYALVYQGVAALPLFGAFRASARHLVLVHFGLALLGAIAFDDVLRQSGDRRVGEPNRWIWLPLAFSTGVPFVAWAWTSSPFSFEGQTIDPAGAVIGAGLILVVTVLLTDASRGSRPALILLPIVLAIDLGVWGFGYVLRGGTQTIEEIARSTQGPPADAGARLHAAETRSPNPLLLRGYGLMRPYVGLAPTRVLQLTTLNELRMAGVDWVQRPDGWRRVSDPMPRLRIVSDVRVTPEPAGEVGVVDVERTAIVDHALPALDPRATVTAVADTWGAMSVDVNSAGNALLATTEAYHPGWMAVGAGSHPLQTVRIYGDYLGVVLEPGEYRVSLTFAPASFRRGAYMSILGVAALLAVLPFSARPRGASAEEPVSGEAG